ncbi:MAG: hypothetical protein HKO87_02630 [Acidimicrobiia bacterium]|nr:hypothetical protein [Acidimicrobiia bacterium]
MRSLTVLTAYQDLPDPEEGVAAWIVWIVMLAVIIGLYLLITRTRRKASEEYWRRRQAEEEARKNDPDMA